MSVITVVYNGEKYLEQTIRSILDQTYSSIEYIIIDGGSTDGTVNIIQKYEHKLAYWISEPDKGIYDAWNKALKVTQGEWIAFVGSDDLLLPDAISDYIDYIQSHKFPPLDYVSSQVELVTEDLRTKRTWGSAWEWNRFKRYMNVAHVGSFHHRDLFKRYGTYNTRYRIAADYELLLRARDQLKAGYFNKNTAKMRVSGVSLSQPKVLWETWHAKVHTAKLSKFISYYDYFIARSKFEIRRIFRPFFIRM